MKIKKITIAIFLILVTYLIDSQTIPTYEMGLVKTFFIGSGDGELKVEMFRPSHGGPLAIAFDKDGNLYVSDWINTRLVRFDNSFNYIKSFKNGYAWRALQLFINGNSELILKSSTTFAVDDSNGDKKFIIMFGDSQYKDKIVSYPTFIYHNNVVYTYLKDGSLISIPNPGTDNQKNIEKILDEKATIEYLQKQKDSSISIYSLSNKAEIVDNNCIVVNGAIQTNDFKQFYYYWKDKAVSNSSYDKSKIKSKVGFEVGPESAEYMTFIGNDLDGNYYWLFVESICVYNNQGDLIALFNFEDNKRKCLPTIHPSGDVYFLDYDDKGVYLYKIKRVW